MRLSNKVLLIGYFIVVQFCFVCIIIMFLGRLKSTEKHSRFFTNFNKLSI